MECGKLTAKLRDMVTVRFFDADYEVKRYHNIEMPDELKKKEYREFEFSVPQDGSITFKIWLEENPTEWPEAKKRKKRAKAAEEGKENNGNKIRGGQKNIGSIAFFYTFRPASIPGSAVICLSGWGVQGREGRYADGTSGRKDKKQIEGNGVPGGLIDVYPGIWTNLKN